MEGLLFVDYQSMKHILSIIICSTFILNAQVYIFSVNIRITNTSNDQKFPQMAIDDNIIDAIKAVIS